MVLLYILKHLKKLQSLESFHNSVFEDSPLFANDESVCIHSRVEVKVFPVFCETSMAQYWRSTNHQLNRGMKNHAVDFFVGIYMCTLVLSLKDNHIIFIDYFCMCASVMRV